MHVTCDPLTAALDRLEWAISEDPANHTSDWIEQAESALGAIEREIREHLAGLALPCSGMDELDRPLLPSPGLHRHSNELRHEFYEFLDEARFLSSRVRSDARNPDAPFFERANRLVQSLRDCEEREFDLIQESVMTDIGGEN